MKPTTYRDLAWDRLVDLLREAAATADVSSEVEAALTQFRSRFDAAVDAVPAVTRALDRPADEDRTDEGQKSEERTVDPINRADEIAAHISETFKKR